MQHKNETITNADPFLTIRPQSYSKHTHAYLYKYFIEANLLATMFDMWRDGDGAK